MFKLELGAWSLKFSAQGACPPAGGDQPRAGEFDYWNLIHYSTIMTSKKRSQKGLALSQSKGFTLIEILVVMVIIGILSVIGLGSFSSSQMKGRDSKRKNDLRQLGLALEAYYNDKGHYPLGSGQVEGCGAGAAQTCSWGAEFSETNGATYMVEMPMDPHGHTYNYQSDGTEYYLFARLENDKDLDVPKDANETPMVYGYSCGDKNCNYGIASSNTTLPSPQAE